MKKVFIKSAAQISVQKPLSDEWLANPVVPTEKMAPTIDPAWSGWLSPMAARRMDRVMKRAVVTSMAALRGAGMDVPDAIVTGTGLGCIEYTEKFMKGMCENAEECVQPSLFMNSTHNTISSQIALSVGCHGYNNTYSHGIISFQSALLDGFLAVRQGNARNALVGGFDEMTPEKFSLLERTGFWKDSFSGETAFSTVLSEDSSNCLCEMAGVDILYRPTRERVYSALDDILRQAGITPADIDLTVCPSKAYPYSIGDKPVLAYEPLFGRSFTSAAFGLYAGALSIARNEVGNLLVLDGNDTYTSLILLRSCFEMR